MALVKAGTKAVTQWSKRDKRATRHALPEDVERPIIDYGRLQKLCEIPGLADRDNPESTEDAHKQFMANYKSMFVRPAQRKGFPIHSLTRTMQRQSEQSLNSSQTSGQDKVSTQRLSAIEDETGPAGMSHNIGDYLSKLRHDRPSEKANLARLDRIKTIRRILKKLPFERSAPENDELYSHLKHFPCLANQVPPGVLKELCVVAYMDQWKEANVTAFGSTGWYLILRGRVRPLTTPHHIPNGSDLMLRSPTPILGEDDDVDELEMGDCFGTLESISYKTINSRILTVLTLEPNCDFMKISCTDFARVLDQIQQRDRTEKVNLLQSCETFGLWSRQPLIKVASCLKWVNFPANTVLVSEGYKSPFIGVIKSGECHVLRQVEVIHTLANGKKERRLKQVVMGKLTTSQSFGEVSVIGQEAMTCSIITASPVHLGCIDHDRIKELDDTICQLLHQSSTPTYGNLTQDAIHEEYVRQELKREWNEFKHNVVVDVINSKGVRPGFGKWAK